MRQYVAFTLVEVLIVVMLLGILAMIILPYVTEASGDAREAALATDLATARKQILLYKAQHNDRSPAMNASGSLDTANFVARMTGRTTPDGKLDAGGSCGPYMTEWPANPYCDDAIAREILFAQDENAPRNGKTGWYYSLSSGQFYANHLRQLEAAPIEVRPIN